MQAVDAVRATAGPLHDLGGRFMASRATFARGAEWGWADGLSFYVAGRGGVLGDVDGWVVTAAFGFFNPDVLIPRWDAGVRVAGAREAARRYNDAAALWGRERLGGVDGMGRLAELGERLLAAAEPAALPLFAGWRSEPRVDDPAGHAAQVIHVLREWRGANHVVATRAAGLRPLEAVLIAEGPPQAEVFGWAPPFPDVSALQPRRGEAEAITDGMCEPAFARGLTPAEREQFASLVAAAHAAVTAGRKR